MRRIWLGLALWCWRGTCAGGGDEVLDRGRLLRGGGAPIRFQATTLAEYLLYTKDGKYIAAGGDAADAPSASTEWVATDDGGQVTLTPKRATAA